MEVPFAHSKVKGARIPVFELHPPGIGSQQLDHFAALTAARRRQHRPGLGLNACWLKEMFNNV